MMIPVTKAFVPSFDSYAVYLKQIWDRRWLTNHGPLSEQLQDELKEYLGVRHLFFVGNGTVALQIAMRALGVTGEIVTSPFSYVATTSSICWEKCVPVFADIDPKTLCLDPTTIERLIGPRTQAIMPVHVYGGCCDVEEIAVIAERHGLKVIYDGAQAFGTRLAGKSILSHGHVSTLSFHATKLFHTAEGGAIITNDDEIAYNISHMMNFGHNGPEAFVGVGINGKNSELHAAMGLAVLPHVNMLIDARRKVSQLYDQLLLKRLGSLIGRPVLHDGLEYNYSYYPILLESEDVLLRVRAVLKDHSIMARRYFYPALTTLNYVGRQHAEVAENIASRVLCLPLYHDLDHAVVAKIVELISATIAAE